MAELRWWRLETDAEGKVLSCTAVAAAAINGTHCFYVKAYNATEAARRLSNDIARRLLEARRAQYRAEGRCKCGRQREDKTFTHCQRCRERGKLHRERQVAKQRGVVSPKLDRRVVLQERKSEERLAVLLEVQQAWSEAQRVGIFTRWLNEQIAAARGRKVA